MGRTSSREAICTKQQRIAKLARESPGMAITTLAHHIDRDWMHEAYRRTRKTGAVGVDGQTAEEFARDLEGNLQRLLDDAKSGRYRAPPVRRVEIPKGDGRSVRPLGIPTFADKVLQRAVLMALEPIYEQDFRDCSYGFRPRRSAHQALQALRDQIQSMPGGWVLEIDIRSFFDEIDRKVVREILRQRVRDGVLLRLISKWLHAGVMKEGVVFYPGTGTPQGGVISPLLGNLVLHEVLDTWFAEQIQPRLKGRSALVRFADDAVLVFECESDARRMLAVLPKRFGRYGLRLHPEKTRLLAFRRPPHVDWQRPGPPPLKPPTFTFLGFTHYWGSTQKGGHAVMRKTARDRFRRALSLLAAWCRRHRHDPIQSQWRLLKLKLRGHYAYYGIRGNAESLRRFRWQAHRVWHSWLNRRDQRGRVTWGCFRQMLRRYPLPKARLVHTGS